MILMATWSAPANVLIAGEYAITRPGGKGIAVAAAPRGVARLYRLEATEVDPGGDDWETRRSRADGVRRFDLGGESTLTVEATFGGGTEPVEWPSASIPIVDAVVETMLPEITPPRRSDWKIEVDTSPFFDERTGAKRGLGSSAVATLLLVTAISEIGSNTDDDVNSLVDRSVRAHRRAADGRGSGYDIVASAVGGAIEFTGGDTPKWTRTDALANWANLGISLWTWSSGKSVSSRRAVERYDVLQPAESAEDRAFLAETNDGVDAILTAASWNELFDAIKNASRRGTSLGETIGVDGSLPFVGCHVDDGWVGKASGAGNERAVIFVNADRRRPLPADAMALTPEVEGIRCEYRRVR